MQETYYLGMEPRWIAHLFSVWYDSGQDVAIEMSRSRKSEVLVIAKVTINNKNYEEVELLNRIWKTTGCKIHKV